MTGIVKGYDFKKNKDSAHIALMLICEISGQKDTQSIEYMANPYDNFIPEIDSTVLIVQITKSWKVAIANYGGVDFDNTLNDGERKLSAPNGAYIKLKDNGTIELNGNAKDAARKDDTTQVNGTTDTAFITWIATVSAFINGLAPGTITNIPTTIDGIITSGTSEVKFP